MKIIHMDHLLKTDGWYIAWQRVTASGKTSDNDWQRVITIGAMNSNVWQRVTTNDND